MNEVSVFVSRFRSENKAESLRNTGPVRIQNKNIKNSKIYGYMYHELLKEKVKILNAQLNVTETVFQHTHNTASRMKDIKEII